MLNCDRGLSISVESSPRSPQSVNQNQEPSYRLCTIAATAATDAVSLSPRSPQPQYKPHIRSVTRRLDFSSVALQDEGEDDEEEEDDQYEEEEESEKQHTLSVASSWEDAKPIQIPSSGECNICYDSLPTRSNHVFTVCGHLFCVKCLLKWWDTSSSCPMCRAQILKLDAGDAVSGPDDDDDGDDDHDDEAPESQVPDAYIYTDAGIEPMWFV